MSEQEHECTWAIIMDKENPQSQPNPSDNLQEEAANARQIRVAVEAKKRELVGQMRLTGVTIKAAYDEMVQKFQNTQLKEIMELTLSEDDKRKLKEAYEQGPQQHVANSNAIAYQKFASKITALRTKLGEAKEAKNAQAKAMAYEAAVSIGRSALEAYDDMRQFSAPKKHDSQLKELLKNMVEALRGLYHDDPNKAALLTRPYVNVWLVLCAPDVEDVQEKQKLIEFMVDPLWTVIFEITIPVALNSQAPNVNKWLARVEGARREAESLLFYEWYADVEANDWDETVEQYANIQAAFIDSELSLTSLVQDHLWRDEPDVYLTQARLYQPKKPEKPEELEKPKEKPNEAPPEVKQDDSCALYQVYFDPNRLVLKSRKRMKKGDLVFSEPVLALVKSGRNLCPGCFRAVSADVAHKCFRCVKAEFCSKKCLDDSTAESKQDKKDGIRSPIVSRRHPCEMCSPNLSDRLSPSAGLLYQLITWCGGKTFIPIFEDYKKDSEDAVLILRNSIQGATFEQFCLVLTFVKYADRLNSPSHAIDPLRLVETYQLISLLTETEKLKPKEANENGIVLELNYDRVAGGLYKMLYIMANAPVFRAPIAITDSRDVRGRARGARAMVASAFGAALSYSHQPNLRRQLNPETGRVEYLALATIHVNEPLTIHWGSEQARKNADKSALKEGCVCSVCLRKTIRREIDENERYERANRLVPSLPQPQQQVMDPPAGGPGVP